MASICGVVLASFSTQVRGIKFYSVPTHHIGVGDQVSCRLEPTNLWDVDCISVMYPMSRMLGHLAREASVYLAPLLRAGFKVFGTVTSLPFSRVIGSGSYRHLVCSIYVTVHGPTSRAWEVRNALSNASLTRLKLKDNHEVTVTGTDIDYDGDNESNDSDTELCNLQDNGTLPDSATRLNSDSDVTRLNSDSDATRLISDSDATRLNSDSDATRLNSDSDITRLNSDSDATRLNSDSDVTRLNSDTDTTPLIVRPKKTSFPKRPSIRLSHNTYNDEFSTCTLHSDSDTTPLIIRPAKKRRLEHFRKRLFNTHNNDGTSTESMDTPPRLK